MFRDGPPVSSGGPFRCSGWWWARLSRRGGVRAVAHLLGISQRTVERYVKDQIKRPRTDLAARHEHEVRQRWQPHVRARSKQAAVTTGGTHPRPFPLHRRPRTPPGSSRPRTSAPASSTTGHRSGRPAGHLLPRLRPPRRRAADLHRHRLPRLRVSETVDGIEVGNCDCFPMTFVKRRECPLGG